MPILAVDGHEVTWLGEVEHQLLIFLTAVPRDMHMGKEMVVHIRPSAEKVVNGAVDQLLVAGDGVGGENHRIAAAQVDLSMFAPGHTHQRRSRLPLTAGAHDGDLFIGQPIHLLRCQQLLGINVQIAQTAGHATVLDHATANETHPPTMAAGSDDHLLHTGDVGSKGGNDHPSLRLAEHLLEGLADLPLRGGQAGSFRVGGVGKQQQHAAVA